MIKCPFVACLLFFFSITITSQESLSDLLKKYNTHQIPYITVQEVSMPKTNVVLLDARELREYNTSHIEDAIHVGFDHFNEKIIYDKIPNKDQAIVVYCTIGIRSEVIAKKLKQLGYSNVYNLYGGIFEWKNNNYKVIDSLNQPTNNIHTFNKAWSKWLKKGNKVYE